MREVRKITAALDTKRLESDLKNYVDLCLSKGASDAAILTQDTILLDPRSPMKCLQPKCMHFGTCRNCPPNIPDFNTFKEVITKYQYAVIYRCKLALADNSPTSRQKVADIVKIVEDTAFYDGYYFAMGFGSGTCKKTWCAESSCQALETGKGCRMPLYARISMEAAGFDVFGIAAKLGWDIYPIGKNCVQEAVPFMNRVGIIMIV